MKADTDMSGDTSTERGLFPEDYDKLRGHGSPGQWQLSNRGLQRS